MKFQVVTTGLTGLFAGAVLAGCATPTSPALERAHLAYATATADPAITQNSPVALYDAQKRLDEADLLLREENDQERVEHLAYLAEKQVEIARALAKQRIAETDIQKLAREREQVRLEARTREVDVARVEAEQARMRAEEQADRARAEARRAEEETAKALSERARAEKLQAELRELQAQQTERGIVLTLGDVLFDFNRAEIRDGARRNLARLVQFLQEHPDREVVIEGHTDAIGADEYNRELSRRRAESVRSFLAENQIAPGRLVSSGLGEGYPVASNDTPEGRQVNRRVEVVILEPGQSAASQVRSPSPVSSSR